MWRTISVSLVICVVVILNVRGHQRFGRAIPHGDVWYEHAAQGRLKDERGQIITQKTHPHEFATKEMLIGYHHGWPVTAMARSAYLGSSWMIPDPDYSPRSSPWPIDSAHIYFVHRSDIAIDFIVGVAIALACWGLCTWLFVRPRRRKLSEAQNKQLPADG